MGREGDDAEVTRLPVAALLDVVHERPDRGAVGGHLGGLSEAHRGGLPNAHVGVAVGGLLEDGRGHVFRAQGLGGAIEGQVDRDLAHAGTSSAAVILAVSARPRTLPSIMAAGPQAQRPRQ